MKFLLPAAAVSALLSASLAHAEAQAVQSAVIPDALVNLIDEMPDADQVASVSAFDMSQNGTPEGLVVLGDDCENSSCEWRLFAETQDGWRAVGSGVAKDAFFEPLADGGAVINSDDITWAYSGGDTIYMWGDSLQGAKLEPASDIEYSFIGANTEYTATPRVELSRYTIDLNGDGSPERIYLIGGLYYQVGMWGTPYVVVDGNDEVILTGISTDRPRVFPDKDGGSLVVNVVPVGIQVNEIK